MLRLLAILLAMLALLIAAMVWSGGGIEKKADFTFINRGDIYTLDINQMSFMQDFRLTYAIREGLYSPHPEDFHPIPAGAVGYDVSDDKKTWTFHLRPGCLWSNGVPVTAHDYVFSWRRMLEDPGPYAYLFYYVHNAENYERSYTKGKPIDFKTVGIEAVDDLTLKVSLDNPVTYMLELAAFPPFYPRNEWSMRPFRRFSESQVFDVLEPCIDSAKKVEAAGTDAALVERFNKLAQTHLAVSDAEPLRTFIQKAAKVDLAWSTLEEVADLLPAFEAIHAFEGGRWSKDDEDDPRPKLRKMIANHHVAYNYRGDYTRPPIVPGGAGVVTNGPFNLTRWEYKRRLILQKSATYWDRANVLSNKIEMVVSENPLSQYLLYETGEVDWITEVAADTAAELKAKNRQDLRISPAFGTAFLSLQCRPQLPDSVGLGSGKKNPLADMRVRRALAMTVDRLAITENITRMGELPARTYLPPDGTLPDFRWLPGPFNPKTNTKESYSPEELRAILPDMNAKAGPGIPYDVEMAKKLLADAGYPNGQGFPALPILYNTDSSVREKIAQSLKEHWKKTLGIDVEVQGIEGKIFKERCEKKEFAIATTAWYGDYPDTSTFTDKYLSTSLQNDSDWQNKEFDDLCAAAAKEGDPVARGKLLSKAEALIESEAPIIPMYHYVNVSLMRDKVEGIKANPRNLTIFKAVKLRN